jgi:hypothetical protein
MIGLGEAWTVGTIHGILLINSNQDFVFTLHSDFFQRQTDKGISIGLTNLIYDVIIKALLICAEIFLKM